MRVTPWIAEQLRRRRDDPVAGGGLLVEALRRACSGVARSGCLVAILLTAACIQSNIPPTYPSEPSEVTIVPESSATLLRAAGYAAFSIIPVLIASGIAFWLFLNGAGAIFGPINDVLTVISLALLALPVLGIRSIAATDVGPWFDVVTVLALVGIAVGAVGQLLLVLGVPRGVVSSHVPPAAVRERGRRRGTVRPWANATSPTSSGRRGRGRSRRGARDVRAPSEAWQPGAGAAPVKAAPRPSGPPRRPRAGPPRGRARPAPCRPAGRRSSRPSASGHRPRPGRPAWARRRCGGR